jgi:hypothetical protein
MKVSTENDNNFGYEKITIKIKSQVVLLIISTENHNISLTWVKFYKPSFWPFLNIFEINIYRWREQNVWSSLD